MFFSARRDDGFEGVEPEPAGEAVEVDDVAGSNRVRRLPAARAEPGMEGGVGGAVEQSDPEAGCGFADGACLQGYVFRAFGGRAIRHEHMAIEAALAQRSAEADAVLASAAPGGTGEVPDFQGNVGA